ncbi:MAG: hypothetical protein ABIJ08_07390 [Nanoarchaeota archaeon]
MKLAYIIAMMLVLFMVGCTTTPQAEQPAVPEAAPEEPPMVPEAAPEEVETPEAAPEASAPVGGDVSFNGKAGFDPAEITIAAGSTLTIVVNDEGSQEYSFRIIGGEATTQLMDGEVGDLAFEEAGVYTVMSIPFNKKLAVTVE